MKYDAGMTQYHDDIVAALRDMLHGEMDKIAELAAEGSPVPLREYLRNNHGTAIHGGNKFEAMSSCFLVPFDHVINNKGDSKLNLSWSQVTSFIRKYPADFFRKSEDEEASLCDDCRHNKLDKYAEAVQLNAQIMTSAKTAQQNLYDMAVGFKKMRDNKLYKELGYDNFGDYCEGETGITRKNVYNYISIVENLPSEFVTSTLQIGKEKLYLLSTINEEHRTEIIENTDLESTTVKELREQIEQLKKAEARSKSKLEHVNTVYEEMYNSCMQNKNLYHEQLNKNAELEQRIKSLEAQPRDVAVQADPEQERKFSETLRKLNLDFENYREEADRDLADMRNQRNAALDRAEAAEARLSTPKAESNIKPFLIKMTMDDFSALINALENEPYLKKIIQKAQVIRL